MSQGDLSVQSAQPSQSLWELIKRVMRLAMPMAGSRLLQMLSGFIGMLMLAHLGHGVLAASALMTATQIAILVTFIALLFSVAVVVGQAYGAGKFYEIGTIIRESCVLALFLSIPLIILFLCVDRLLLWSGQIPGLVSYVRTFFHALVWGTPAYVILAALQQACYGMLKQKFVIIGNVICLSVFIPTAYALIYGGLGIPAQGVAGLSYALAIQTYLNVLYIVLGFYYLKQFKPLQLFSKRKDRKWCYLRQLFAIGWPMSVQFGGELLGFFVIAMMIGWLGTSALAAAQVTQQCMFLFIVPMFAVAEATGILVSQSVGGKHYRDIQRETNVCVGVSISIAVIFTVIFIFFPKLLASLYLDVNDPHNAMTVHLIKILFIIVIFLLTFESWRHIFTGALRGLYDTRFAMWVGIISIWVVSVPLGYLLGFPAHLGVIGFRLASTLALLIGALLVYWHWRMRLREFNQR